MRCRHLFCVLSLALAVLSGSARGQKLEDGEVQFKNSKAFRATSLIRRQLAQGDVVANPKDKDHREAIDIEAKYIVYPLSWESDKGFIPGSLNKIVEAWSGQLATMSSPKRRDRTVALQPLLCKEVIDRCVEVTEQGKPIIAVNAAIMLFRIVERRTKGTAPQPEKEWAEDVLPRLAEGNGEHLAGACLTLLTDPKLNDAKTGKVRDGARYYLFRTLSSLLAVPAKSPVVKKETAEKAVLTALAFVEKAPKLAKNTPREDVEGYKVLRREAVKVVAQSPSAAVGEKGYAALVLGRVAAADERITPTPRLDERMEAAIGLCRLIAEAKKSPGLEVDYAAACVARAVQAFGAEANANIDKKGLERTRPWIVDAARLSEAVESMKGDGKNAYLSNAVKQCLAVLTPVTGGNQARPGDLGEWLERNVPAAKAMYRGVEDATVKPGGGAPVEDDD